jgi:hypothetical protein
MMIFMPNDDTRKKWLAALAAAALMLLSGCGTTHATIETSRGEQLMLLGYDPGRLLHGKKPVRGKHTLPAAHEGAPTISLPRRTAPSSARNRRNTSRTTAASAPTARLTR